MRAPDTILSIWRQFDRVPMETFTKGWWHTRCEGKPRQRTPAEMEEHRRLVGAGGNCFDMAVWLQHRLQGAGVHVRLIGHDLETPEAHVAVLARSEEGFKYLCDLGDQWLEPILISPESPEFSGGWQEGFFPGRSVRVERTPERVLIHYRRATGKVSQQAYQLDHLNEEDVRRACDHSQRLLRRPFCEMLLPDPDTGERVLWEYDRGESFWNLEGGPVFEPKADSQDGWVNRIATRTGMAPELIRAGFAAYARQEGANR